MTDSKDNEKTGIATTKTDQGTFEKWSYLFSTITGYGITDEEKQKRNQEALDLYWERMDKSGCETCPKWRDELVHKSPLVKFLMDHINSLPRTENEPKSTPESSQTPDLPLSIDCVKCPMYARSSYNPKTGISLCRNTLTSKSILEDHLAHEMIHAWDERRFKIDWYNPRHFACSEIRAENLSGECRWMREFERGTGFKFTKQRQECVRRRTIASLTHGPTKVSEEEATRIVDSVWKSCWHDTRPFDNIYR